MNSKKLFIVFIAVLCLFMSGCRPSETLTEVLYRAEAPEVDLDNPEKLTDNQPEHTQEDEDLSPLETVPESEDRRDRVEHDPVQGESEAEAPAPETEFIPNADDTVPADDAPTDSATSQDGESAAGGDEGNDESAAQEGDSGAQSGGAGDSGFEADPSASGTRQIVDAYGKIVSLPENIDTVAAVSEAALLVQMLGGEGKLAASNASWLQSELTRAVFGDEGIAEVPALWSGSGSQPMTEEGFEELLLLAPSACVELSNGTAFSDEQILRMNDAGIAYVVLPSMSTSEGLRSAVSLMGELLDDKSGDGGTNAPKLAQEYDEYYASAIGEIGGMVDRFTYNLIDFDNDKRANGVRYINEFSLGKTYGYYSLFIDGCDENAVYALHDSVSTTVSGRGLAVCRSGYSHSPLSYYMSLAGVVNASASYPDYMETKNWYINPLASITKTLTVTGGYGTQSSDALTVVDDSHLGDEDFPAVIVTDDATRRLLETDPLWRVYGAVESSSGLTVDNGFLDEGGNIVPTTIRGDFQILVNPSGVGCWYDGSVESVLEPFWVAASFYETENAQQLNERVKAFYSSFYRHELTEGELKMIFGQ